MKNRVFLLAAIALTFGCEKAPDEVAVASVTLSQTTSEMLVGESVQLSATVLPSNATDKSVIWSSSKQSVAKVTESGRVTAIAEGISTITASASGKSATCIVTVSESYVAVSSITLNKQTLSLEKGASETMTATILPSDATNKTVIWSSSDSKVVSVEQNGKVIAIGGGTAVIMAKADSQTATCAVTVAVPVTSITLDKEALTLEEESSVVLTATINPTDATDKTITWSCSNTSIVTVDNAGKVTAVKEGSAVITAKAGAKEAKCTVTVQKKIIPVSSITLNKTTLSIEKGASETLTATVGPEDATDKTVTWSTSSPEVASVDEDGKVTANAGGEAIITAKAGEKSATCTIIVTVLVESITLNKNTLALYEGKTEVLIATVKPDDATDSDVTWGSANTGVATVDEEGKVTAIVAGETNIIAMAGGKTASCKVVVEKDSSAEAIIFSDSNVKEKLVVAFDTNGDGELSYAEAAAVTDGEVLKESFGSDTAFISFNEFQYFTGITSVPGYMFYSWGQLKTITLPNSIKVIGESAFGKCFHLENIVIPDGVSSIGGGAFASCTGIQTMIIPAGITVIERETFKGCSSLLSVSLPNSIKTISWHAFNGCSNLKSINFPEGLEFIGMAAFYKCGIESITFPSSLVSVDQMAFYGNSNLVEIVFRNELTWIASYAFQDCIKLSSITLPAKLKQLSNGVFWGCIKLSTISLPEGLTEIRGSAFYRCNNLDSIVIPAQVASIGSQAFKYCNDLKTVYVLATYPPVLGSEVFYTNVDWDLNYLFPDFIYVPRTSVESYKNSTSWKEYESCISPVE